MQSHEKRVYVVQQPGDIPQPTKRKSRICTNNNSWIWETKNVKSKDLSFLREVMFQVPFCNPGWKASYVKSISNIHYIPVIKLRQWEKNIKQEKKNTPHELKVKHKKK